MSLLSQRIILRSTDVSRELNDYKSGSVTPLYEQGDYLYIGAEVPFNNLWFEIATPNLLAANIAIDIWWGNKWVPAVDIINSTGHPAALTQSGRIQWNLDILKGWDHEHETRFVTGLTDFDLYDMYWLRMSFSATLSAGMVISYIGQKLASEVDLYDFYPDLNKAALKTSFAANKEDWDRQLYLATDEVIRALKGRGKLFHRGQILDHTVWTSATVHKTAELIYHAMGQAYENSRVLALRSFDEAMRVGYARIDTNLSGRLSQQEKRAHTVFGSR